MGKTKQKPEPKVVDVRTQKEIAYLLVEATAALAKSWDNQGAIEGLLDLELDGMRELQDNLAVDEPGPEDSLDAFFEHFEDFVTRTEKPDFTVSSGLPDDIDPECRELCEAINRCPGLQTYESCCGHGKTPYMIFFTVKEIPNMLPLAWAADSCHSGARGWKIVAYTDCSADKMRFMLEGPVMEHIDDYKEADKIVKAISDFGI